MFSVLFILEFVQDEKISKFLFYVEHLDYNLHRYYQQQIFSLRFHWLGFYYLKTQPYRINSTILNGFERRHTPPTNPFPFFRITRSSIRDSSSSKSVHLII